jgi:hypothetical protein
MTNGGGWNVADDETGFGDANWGGLGVVVGFLGIVEGFGCVANGVTVDDDGKGFGGAVGSSGAGTEGLDCLANEGSVDGDGLGCATVGISCVAVGGLDNLELKTVRWMVFWGVLCGSGSAGCCPGSMVRRSKWDWTGGVQDVACDVAGDWGLGWEVMGRPGSVSCLPRGASGRFEAGDEGSGWGVSTGVDGVVSDTAGVHDARGGEATRFWAIWGKLCGVGRFLGLCWEFWGEQVHFIEQARRFNELFCLSSRSSLCWATDRR